MADIGELLTPSIKEASSAEFNKAIKGMGSDLEANSRSVSEITLDQILDDVYKWENFYQNKVQPNEVAALLTLSEVLGTVGFVSGHKEKEIERSKSESIKMQQDILRTVFTNLKEDGRPNEVVERSFGLVMSVFEQYFNPDNPKVTGRGVITEFGLWQGAMGMVTTALMFKNEGWEVRLPRVELDRDFNIDLVVVSPQGKIYAVDATSKKMGFNTDMGEYNDPFFVESKPVGKAVENAIEGVAGKIRINVPPLDHIKSELFYERRLSGYPSKTAMERFKSCISGL